MPIVKWPIPIIGKLADADNRCTSNTDTDRHGARLD